MNPRFPSLGRRQSSHSQQLLKPVLGLLALLFSPLSPAHTELVMNRQTLENTVSIETQLFGPVQIQLNNSKSGALKPVETTTTALM